MPPIIIAAAVIGAAGAGAVAIGASQQKKAAKKASSEAKEQEERAAQRADESSKRIEEATRLTPRETEREERAFGLEKGRQTELEKRAGLSGEDLLKDVGPETRRLLESVAARQGMTGEELFRSEGDISRALQEEVLRGARDPGGQFEDTLKERLELSRLEINKEANRRGVFGGLPEGGIRFEQLGRAGVDLAINSARERESARQTDLANASTLATQFLSLSAAARGEAGNIGEAGRAEQERARAELASFLQNIQSLTESARGREASGVVRGQELDVVRTEPAAARRFETTQDILGIQAGQGARLQEAGLSAIGKAIGVGFNNIPFSTKTPSKRTEDFDKLAIEESSLDRFGRRSGAEFASPTSLKLRRTIPN